MTALSTIVGILPIALGLGAGGESRAPLGIAVVGGMLFSTLLTFVVVPATYFVIGRARGDAPRTARRVTPARSPAAARKPPRRGRSRFGRAARGGGGLTEFLPISSTGHLILTSWWLDFHGQRAELFEIFIQIGAILSVAVEYRARFTELARELPRSDAARAFVVRLGIAFVPAAALGFFAHDFIADRLFSPRAWRSP